MKTKYDNELLIKLKDEIEKEYINIYENTENFIDEIEINYPMGFSGIDWSQKKNYISIA